MIQRVQTIYLSLVVIMMILAFVFAHAVFSMNGEEAYSYFVHKIVSADASELQPGNWLAQIGLIALICIVSIAAIASFKNRKRQLQLGNLNYLLLITFILSDYFSIKNMPMLFEGGDELATLFSYGFYFPVAAIAFQFLANRGIKKDEALVRSVERLR